MFARQTRVFVMEMLICESKATNINGISIDDSAEAELATSIKSSFVSVVLTSITAITDSTKNNEISELDEVPVGGVNFGRCGA